MSEKWWLTTVDTYFSNKKPSAMKIISYNCIKEKIKIIFVTIILAYSAQKKNISKTCTSLPVSDRFLSLLCRAFGLYLSCAILLYWQENGLCRQNHLPISERTNCLPWYRGAKVCSTFFAMGTIGLLTWPKEPKNNIGQRQRQVSSCIHYKQFTHHIMVWSHLSLLRRIQSKVFMLVQKIFDFWYRTLETCHLN